MKDNTYKQYKSDNLLGFQENKPVFIKLPFSSFGKQWKAGEEFNWQFYPCRAEDYDRLRVTIKQLYELGKIHHDSSREVEQKVGDRLGELSNEKIHTLILRVNTLVKERTTTDKEYRDKRLKQSKIIDKQRGIIRAWLNRNNWALEEYLKIRDDLLDSTYKEPTE